MARNLRLDVHGVPQHIVQRGVNRSVCFRDNLDHEFYLSALEEAKRTYDCEVHTYVLMSNHVHLLVTGLVAGSVSTMMQSLGRRYVRRFNNRYGRTGTLREGRFKSSLVDSEPYLLTCYRYIELNPVRAKMVEDPFDHQWSSVHSNAAGQSDRLVTPHSVYLGLDKDPDGRQGHYRELLFEGISDKDLASIRQHLGQCKALGSSTFQRQIEVLTGRSARLRKPGRPKRCT